MKIVVFVHRFYPLLGGIESFTALMARSWTQLGHSVCVMTPVAACPLSIPYDAQQPYAILRRPGLYRTARCVQQADIVYHSNLSLRALWPVWPILCLKKPLCITHHIWIRGPGNRVRWQDHLKHWVCRHAHNVAISYFMASQLQAPCHVIYDPYDATLFRPNPLVRKEESVLFVGRLEPEKGVAVLLKALHLLKARSYPVPPTRIVGTGSQLDQLAQLSQAYGLGQHVTFLGPMTGPALAAQFQQSTLCVIPSSWDEPFGMVALEAMACGCRVIASHTGGLPEAVGLGGVTVPPNDSEALALALKKALNPSQLHPAQCQAALAHLKAFEPLAIAQAYLAFFQDILSKV
jgi:glycosyltransferase involved in cell wall biosynthesis